MIIAINMNQRSNDLKSLFGTDYCFLDWFHNFSLMKKSRHDSKVNLEILLQVIQFWKKTNRFDRFLFLHYLTADVMLLS